MHRCRPPEKWEASPLFVFPNIDILLVRKLKRPFAEREISSLIPWFLGFQKKAGRHNLPIPKMELLVWPKNSTGDCWCGLRVFYGNNNQMKRLKLYI